MKWHSLNQENVLQELRVHASTGLSVEEVSERRLRFGFNQIQEQKKFQLLSSFLNQFKNPLIYLLLLAAIVAFLFEEVKDSIVIFVVVLFNAIIGAYQEFKADESLKKIKDLLQTKVQVRRGGRELTIFSEELVPGDILILSSGEKIPADVRILESYSLKVNESILTGESLAVLKDSRAVPEDALLADRSSMLYSGTTMTTGRCVAVVVATGDTSEIGKIAKLTKEVKDISTPLEVKVHKFSQMILLFSLGIFIFIMILGLIQELQLKELLLVAISQVVSLVPEGLPVAMTIAAAVGVRRMAQKKAVMRKISAVETLGSISVICSDKTGTMTENKMKVLKVVTKDLEILNLKNLSKRDPKMEDLFKVALLCNDGKIQDDEEVGDPTETALILAGKEFGFSHDETFNRFPRVNEIPFDADLKLMMTEHENEHGRFIALKGAPHVVLEFSSLSNQEKEKILTITNELSNEGLRSLGFAILEGYQLSEDISYLKNKFEFLGLVGQMDPPRLGVKEALRECSNAGIRTIMLTGDHQGTAISIAKKLELYQEGDLVFDGDHLKLENIDFQKLKIISRVRPDQKLHIVQELQERGEVVAMTGDGVNDAPALAKADVGIAMGKSGTDVAREASKMVIMDDHFESIVSAIKEGRVVYKNIKKIVFLLFSTSLAELGVLIFALLLGFPSPFLAVQILWNNLVTEGVITVNLILDPAEGNELDSKPISRGEKLISRLMWKRILLVVPVIIFLGLSWFILRLKQGIDLSVIRSETLTLLVLCEWFNVLNSRSEIKSALSLDLLKNKWLLGGLLFGNFLHILVIFWRPLGDYFHTSPIDLKIVPILAVLASFVLIVEEIRKLWAKKSKLPGNLSS